MGSNRRLLEVAGARYLVVGAGPPSRDHIRDRPAAGGGRRRRGGARVVPGGAAAGALGAARGGRGRARRRSSIDWRSGSDQLGEMVLLEATPPSGFLGALGDSVGAVGFPTTSRSASRSAYRRPRRASVSPRRSGKKWSATVGGRPAAILRVDYAFGAGGGLEGECVIEFRLRRVMVPDRRGGSWR